MGVFLKFQVYYVCLLQTQIPTIKVGQKIDINIWSYVIFFLNDVTDEGKSLYVIFS